MISDSQRATIQLSTYPDINLPCTIKIDKENRVTLEILKVSLKLEPEDRYQITGGLESGTHILIPKAWVTLQQSELGGTEYDYTFESFEILLGESSFDIAQQSTIYQLECDYFSEWKNSRLLNLDTKMGEDMLLSIPHSNEEQLLSGENFSIWLMYSPNIHRKFRPDHGFEITESWYFEISSEFLTYADFKEIGRKLIRFFAFSIQKPIEAKPRAFKQRDAWYRCIQYYPEKTLESDDNIYIRKLLAYHEIQNKFHPLLERWLRLYEICGSSIDTYLGIHSNEHLYWENRFLMQAQSLEGLHKAISQMKKYPDEQYQTIRQTIINSVPEEYQSWIASMINNYPETGGHPSPSGSDKFSKSIKLP